MAIDWDAIYKQKWQELAGGYKKREDALNSAKAGELAQLNAALEQNRGYLKNQRDENMRQAYVSQMNSYLELPETLRKSGLNGGITESAAADILRTYQSARTGALNAYAEGEGKLNAEYGKNKSALDNRYLTLFKELEDARAQDVWEQTKFAYNAALEEQKKREAEAAALEEKRRWEAQQALAEAKQQELIRQFNEQMAFKQQQAAWEQAQQEAASVSSASSGSSKKSGTKKSSSKKSSSEKAQSPLSVQQMLMNAVRKNTAKRAAQLKAVRR